MGLQELVNETWLEISARYPLDHATRICLLTTCSLPRESFERPHYPAEDNSRLPTEYTQWVVVMWFYKKSGDG